MRPWTGGSVWACAAAILLLAACEQDAGGGADPGAAGTEPAAGEQPETPKEPETDEPERAPPDPDDPLALRVHELARKAAEGMIPASPMYDGRLEQGRVRDYQAVLKSVHCYRAVAAGSDGVEDLDLLVFDGNGVPVRQDAAADPNPVVGLSHPICPKTPGLYRVQIKMFEGSGEFRMRLFRTD